MSFDTAPEHAAVYANAHHPYIQGLHKHPTCTGARHHTQSPIHPLTACTRYSSTGASEVRAAPATVAAATTAEACSAAAAAGGRVRRPRWRRDQRRPCPRPCLLRTRSAGWPAWRAAPLSQGWARRTCGQQPTSGGSDADPVRVHTERGCCRPCPRPCSLPTRCAGRPAQDAPTPPPGWVPRSWRRQHTQNKG